MRESRTRARKKVLWSPGKRRQEKKKKNTSLGNRGRDCNTHHRREKKKKSVRPITLGGKTLASDGWEISAPRSGVMDQCSKKRSIRLETQRDARDSRLSKRKGRQRASR